MHLGLVEFLVVVALLLLGAMFLKRRRLGAATRPDPGPVIIAFGGAFPEEAIRDVVLTEDRRAAFLRLADGKTGFVETHGNRYAMRIIGPGSVQTEGPVGARGLSIAFKDTTGKDIASKPATFVFSNPQDAAEVSLWLCGSFTLAEAAALNGPEGSAAR